MSTTKPADSTTKPQGPKVADAEPQRAPGVSSDGRPVNRYGGGVPKTTEELMQGPPPGPLVNWDRVRPRGQQQAAVSRERTDEAPQQAPDGVAHGAKTSPSEKSSDTRAVLAATIAEAEQLATMLRTAPKDQPVDTAAATAAISAQLTQVQVLAQPLSVDDRLALNPDFERLDRTIRLIFQLGHLRQMPLAESGLADLFDSYDRVLIPLGKPPEALADSYYACVVTPASQAAGTTQSASTIEGELLHDGAAGGSAPVTCEDLVTKIGSFASDLGGALQNGHKYAAAVITEPPPPENPSKLEILAEIAAGFVLTGCGVGVGKLIDVGFGAVREGLEAHIGVAVADMLKDTFKDTAKDAIKDASTPNSKDEGGTDSRREGAPTPDANSALSPKTKFLIAAQSRTTAAIDQTKHRFVGMAHELKRTPEATLQALVRAFDSSLLAKIQTAYSDSMIREWLGFTKSLREDDTRPRSKLDNALQPAGVLNIRLEVEGTVTEQDTRKNLIGAVRLARAHVPGVTPAVVENLRKQPFTLGSMPVARRVVCSANNWPDATFDLDRSGTVALAPMPPLSRALLAKIAGIDTSTADADEGEALLGAFVLLEFISGLPNSRISE